MELASVMQPVLPLVDASIAANLAKRYAEKVFGSSGVNGVWEKAQQMFLKSALSLYFIGKRGSTMGVENTETIKGLDLGEDEFKQLAIIYDKDLNGYRRARYLQLGMEGGGAVGDVFKGVDVHLSSPEKPLLVAIKRNDNEGCSPEEIERRREIIRCEGKILASLPRGVGPVVYHSLEDGDYTYLFTEFIPQGNFLNNIIDENIKNKKFFSFGTALEIVENISGKLELLRASGLNHRDLKPMHIALQGKDTRFVDYGIAIKINPSGNTKVDGIYGTVNYIPLDEFLSKEFNSQMRDMYALALIYLEMITGYKLHSGRTEESVRTEASQPEKPLVLDLCKLIHAKDEDQRQRINRVEVVLKKALAKSPETRYQTKEEFIASLREAVFAETVEP